MVLTFSIIPELVLFFQVFTFTWAGKLILFLFLSPSPSPPEGGLCADLMERVAASPNSVVKNIADVLLQRVRFVWQAQEGKSSTAQYNKILYVAVPCYVIPWCIPIASLRSKHCISERPLRVGLIHDA